ncbi:chitin synthase [Coprinopsis sp. MPI-PUGE-AT-0042]|nr:chitin synthase [Coprinopsis sp. MPI-PUGE-AT-0042]
MSSAPSRNSDRPPRAARPGRQSAQPSPSPASPYDQQGFNQQHGNHYPQQQQPQQPQYAGRPSQPSHGVSFQQVELGDRHAPVDQPRTQRLPSAYTHDDLEGADQDGSKVFRKKSLVRPDREKIDPHHRQFHYRNHVAQLEQEGNNIGVQPSRTGNYPHGQPPPHQQQHQQQQQQNRETLRRGRSLLAREEGDVSESGLNIFRRAQTMRRRRVAPAPAPVPTPEVKKQRGCWKGPGPGGPWMTFCLIITFWMPGFLLRACGISSPEQQRAWREKMGIVSLILLMMAGVGFLTFGFTKSVCGTPPNRYHGGAVGPDNIGNVSVIIHGYNYDFSKFKHPAAGSTFETEANPLTVGGWDLGGNDASMLFQKTNEKCRSIITKSNTSNIEGTGNFLDWYFPCNIYPQTGNRLNTSNYDSPTNCHSSTSLKAQLSNKRALAQRNLKLLGQVYYTWEDVKNTRRNLAVYESNVLDLNLLNALSTAQVNYPSVFDDLKRGNNTFQGKDLTMYFLRKKQRAVAECLQDIVTIGFIDTNSIGCVASEVVLYLSLVFIIGVVAIRFVMAVMFQWFFSWRLGNFPKETYEERMARSAAIEQWSDSIHAAPATQWRPDAEKKAGNRKTMLPNISRFTPAGDGAFKPRPTTAYGKLDSHSTKRSTLYSPSIRKGTPPDSPSRNSRSTMSLVDRTGGFIDSQCPFPLHNVVPQPPPDYEPFNFPLAHTICLVTAYSESIEGLRTTLDSIATTDYPNSHKLILVIADGMVKGDGNNMMTPDIVLGMMKDFVIAPSDVEAHSYVAIADGHKRHNMAKPSKQQRIPVVLVAKVGNPRERSDAKPGNRGKRDSQIVLMAFLQKVMFDERMTTFEYEFFNSIWRVTGVSPDRYELVLCVDADTKCFPDSLTRMISCMVCDEEIMGLCGETKIANKAETFITMMQVFEYYISHHMTKAFESMFGGVTCLPGCFSMYRIKAPKGEKGYWVPILANPDIVEHYSENVVDTLHKKNLLLLGEDRYLTTLMLKTFPKRKNMFCPQAVCKTIVPDTFRVLLLPASFVGMELAGTLVLPAAYLRGSSNTIPLILLGIVLGLPGLLIVVTSRKVAYLGWMMVYFVSLPIWNGILPCLLISGTMDDFSWGQTRKIQGETAGADHGDKEGEFDSTHIVMKKWAEFERERLWKKGMASRDSGYYNEKRSSLISYPDAPVPPPMDTNSTADSSNYSVAPRSRHDSTALLMLPAPLSANRQLMTSTPSVGMSRSSEDHYYSDSASANQRLISSPAVPDHYSDSVESASTSTHTHSRSPLPSAPEPKFTPYSDYEQQARQRGVGLQDNGPVPQGGEGVRRVGQHHKRPPSNRYSRNSTAFSLPPGAAPPQAHYGPQ